MEQEVRANPVASGCTVLMSNYNALHAEESLYRLEEAAFGKYLPGIVKIATQSNSTWHVPNIHMHIINVHDQS